MCSRPASTVRSAPAAFQRPVPITRWCYPSAGVCLTRHHRGFICIHPSALPQPVIPGWNGNPWASTSGFAPHSCPRRTLRRGQTVHTGLGPTPSTSVDLLGDFHSTQATSRRKCSKQHVTAPRYGSGIRLEYGLTRPRRKRRQTRAAPATDFRAVTTARATRHMNLSEQISNGHAAMSSCSWW
jgi:hypothetical protein